MRLPAELQQLIPLEKSWMIRMGMLDLRVGRTDTKLYLQNHRDGLGDDLLALLRILEQWGSDQPLDVGESGTLFRFVRYLQMLVGNNQRVITHGTLKHRVVSDDKSVLGLSIGDLLKLDSGTSQWASAAVLFTDVSLPKSVAIPYHLQMSADAKSAQLTGFSPRVDITIQRQAEAYWYWSKTGDIQFNPVQSEDFPFAVAFGVMTLSEGELKWPQLRNHETDRVAEMKRFIGSPTIDSLDHRVVQALVMRYSDRSVSPLAKWAVNKTWPLFWSFLDGVKKLQHQGL